MYVQEPACLYTSFKKKQFKAKKRFLLIDGLQNCIRGYWNQTKFPIHKVWWLREATQIGQTFIPLCEKVV